MNTVGSFLCILGGSSLFWFAVGANLDLINGGIGSKTNYYVSEPKSDAARAVPRNEPLKIDLPTIPTAPTLEPLSTVTVETPSTVTVETPSTVTVETPSTVTVETPSTVAVETPSTVTVETPSTVTVETPSTVTVETPSTVTVETPSTIIFDPKVATHSGASSLFVAIDDTERARTYRKMGEPEPNGIPPTTTSHVLNFWQLFNFY